MTFFASFSFLFSFFSSSSFFFIFIVPCGCAFGVSSNYVSHSALSLFFLFFVLFFFARLDWILKSPFLTPPSFFYLFIFIVLERFRSLISLLFFYIVTEMSSFRCSTRRQRSFIPGPRTRFFFFFFFFFCHFLDRRSSLQGKLHASTFQR